MKNKNNKKEPYLPETGPAKETETTMSTDTTASESFEIKLSTSGSILFPTMNLRFVERELPADKVSLGKVMAPARTVRVLQQQFTNNGGKFQWTDVQLVKIEGCEKWL